MRKSTQNKQILKYIFFCNWINEDEKEDTKHKILKYIFFFSWVKEGEEEDGMAGAALLATQSKLGRPLLQDEKHFVRLQVQKHKTEKQNTNTNTKHKQETQNIKHKHKRQSLESLSSKMRYPLSSCRFYFVSFYQ